MRVLVADDCPIMRLRLKKHLTEWGFQPVLVNDGKQALDALSAKFAPRLAVLDWMMPIMDGPTVTRHIRKQEFGPYTYVVMLTARTEADDLISAFAAGIDDFLTKPFNAEELRQRLRAGQRILNLHDKLNQTLETLKFQATHDALTGIWNRSATLDALERELGRAGRNLKTPEATSIVMLDLDRFKSINDTHGHLAGDKVLVSIGEVIRKSLRSYDYVGRYGGEEFIVILPSTAREQVEIVVERIRRNIEKTPVQVGGLSIQVTASLGVATAQKDNDVEELIKVADEAMYRAKKNGRNRCVFADPVDLPDLIAPNETVLNITLDPNPASSPPQS
jgi:two-component system cell cycle response regulator